MKNTLSIAAALLLLGGGAACAESPPSMVGTWKPTGETAAAKIGEANAGWGETAKPAFNLQPRPYVVVEVQDGRKIGGYAVVADGAKEPFVGVFTRTGRLIVSTMKGTASADFMDGTMEWCWSDNLDKAAIVGCDVMSKQPSN